MPKSTEITKSMLEDVEAFLHHGYVEEDVFIGDCCLSFKTLSSAAEREIWMRYKNILTGHQVYFVIDLLSASIHRVNGRRLESPQAAREFFLGLPARFLLGLYRLFRNKLMKRVQLAQDVPFVGQGVAMVDIELGVLHPVQQHVHAGEVVSGDVHFLPVDFADGAIRVLDPLAHIDEEGAGAAGEVGHAL